MKSARVPIGALAPDFELPAVSDGSVILSGLRGQPVLLVFFRGHWCRWCRRQLSQLNAAYPAMRSLNAQLVAVSSEELGNSRSVGVHLAFPILSDPELDVIDRYGIRDDTDDKGRAIARPSVFVLDALGVVRYGHVGVDPQDRPAIGALLLAVESIA